MPSKLTVFGRMTRKLRVEHDEFLKDMAARLHVSTAYLSAVERGHRNAPFKWISLLQGAYGLSFDEVERMEKARLASQTYNQLDVSHLSVSDKQIMESVSVCLPTFNSREREQLQQLINREYRK